MNRIIKLVILLAVIITCITCDQATKKIAKETLSPGIPVIYFNDIFRFQYAENEGAFLSLGSNLPDKVSFWILRIIPLLFLIAIFATIIYKLGSFTFLRLLSLALIFSGGTSNIIDRFINNRLVVDFMNMGIGGLRTGIFNFADLFILSGAALLFISYLNEKKNPQNKNETAKN